MQFKSSTKGVIPFKITIYDRLNNKIENFNYEVHIPNDITIIGETVKSNKRVETKIGVTDKVKISSRKE